MSLIHVRKEISSWIHRRLRNERWNCRIVSIKIDRSGAFSSIWQWIRFNFEHRWRSFWKQRINEISQRNWKWIEWRFDMSFNIVWRWLKSKQWNGSMKWNSFNRWSTIEGNERNIGDVLIRNSTWSFRKFSQVERTNGTSVGSSERIETERRNGEPVQCEIDGVTT